jgi:TRAP-type C4-dicarboxylate transport system substrate-binding protein
MGGMKNRSRLAALVLTAIAAFAAAGCGGGGGGEDKAGGPGAPVTLRLANTGGSIDQTPAVEYFVKRVDELSGGNVRIEVVDQWAEFASDAEQQVVRGVSNGEIDLGWVGTRVFDTIGFRNFQALTAPMLVDSYALEEAVIESGVTEEMMQGLDELGVVGLGVLADGLRRPIGVTAPLLGPADWRGITFGTLRSNGQVEAIRALGATPAQIFGSEREEALGKGTIQGFEFSMWLFSSTPKSPSLAPYVAANVTLWPQMDVLIANPARLEALTTKQRGWVEQAARDAAARSAALADKDAQALGVACESGARFAEASDADLAALEAAFAPANATLQEHPETKEFIDRIRALKQSTPPGPALSIPADCTGEAPEQAAAGAATPNELHGIYRWTLTKEDALASESEGKSPEHLATFPWTFTMTLKDGKWTLRHTEAGQASTDGPDPYSVQGNRISFDWRRVGAILIFTFSVEDEGDLHLQPVDPMDAGDQFVWATHPWTKID